MEHNPNPIPDEKPPMPPPPPPPPPPRPPQFTVHRLDAIEIKLHGKFSARALRTIADGMERLEDERS